MDTFLFVYQVVIVLSNICVLSTGFDLDEDFDEEYAFQEVVHNMLGKDIVDVGSVNADILHTKTTKFKDPTAKMELRHKQVRFLQTSACFSLSTMNVSRRSYVQIT